MAAEAAPLADYLGSGQAMTKEEMVHKLVAHSVQAALADSKRYWLSDVFERGFAGYRNYSADRLRRELQLRGLSQPVDELMDEDAGADEDWDDGTESLLDVGVEPDYE
jgi:hypothetical protein